MIEIETDRPERTAPGFGAVLGRFALAGVAAGALSGAWSLLVTERVITPALVLEEARSAASDAGGHHSEELFGRTTQLVGGVLGTLLAAVFLAVVFAVVFMAVRHRLPARTDFGRVAVLGAVGFAVVALLPAIKLPANPPAVGDPSTVGRRTAIYGAVLLLGAVTVLLVAATVSALRSRGLDVPTTTAGAVVVGALLVALVLVLLPGSPDRIADDVPAALIWNFRLASLGQLAVLWTTLSLAAGWLLDRMTALR